jgi:hypothetical protein
MNGNYKPIAAISVFTGMFMVLSASTTWVGLTYRFISLNENQILYLFSTSAQVIAAIYGLTLTGFIFFRNELSREEFEDETLSDAVESLKYRFFYLLLFVTAFVILTLLLSNLAISHEDSGSSFLNTFIINTGQSAFVTTLIAISYFIFDVISPKKIELASKTLQNKLDPTRTEEAKGSLEEFLKNYNQIELLLAESGQMYQETSPVAYERKFQKRLSNSRLAEFLFRNERIDKSLFMRVRELITLRNSIIHGADPVVSEEMVQVSNQVLQELRTALERGSDEH